MLELWLFCSIRVIYVQVDVTGKLNIDSKCDVFRLCSCERS